MRKYFTVAGVLLAMSASQVVAETLLERGTYSDAGHLRLWQLPYGQGRTDGKHELAGGFAMKKGPIDAFTPNLTPIREPVPAAGPMPN